MSNYVLFTFINVYSAEKVTRPKKKEDDFEEIITELKTKVHFLEAEQESAVTHKEDFTADYEHVKNLKQVGLVVGDGFVMISILLL